MNQFYKRSIPIESFHRLLKDEEKKENSTNPTLIAIIVIVSILFGFLLFCICFFCYRYVNQRLTETAGALPMMKNQNQEQLKTIQLEQFNLQDKVECQTCSICLLDNNKEKSVKTICKHWFHRECLTAWSEKSDLCPICRHCIK